MTKQQTNQDLAEKIISEDISKNEDSAPRFSRKSYELDENDEQLRYLWPFVEVTCSHNEKIGVKKTDNMGLGVFAKEDIAQGEYLCCYFGKLTHIPEGYSDYTFDIRMPNNAYYLTIDAKESGNISRYINHSYDANCESLTEFHYAGWQKSSERPYSPSQDWQYISSKEDENRFYYYKQGQPSTWDKPNEKMARWPEINREEPHITFRAKRDIKKGEQLFINYGEAYWKTRDKNPE
jgi:SET domain-containing protein